MITVIVPTDFSESAKNAAIYAGQMLTGNYDLSLVLYHVYKKDEEEQFAKGMMEELKEEVKSKSYLRIECLCEKGTDFVKCLDRLCRHTDAQLIIMSTSGKTNLTKVFFGSNTMKMVNKNSCPVMIIPPDAQYKERLNVALMSDFREVNKTTPVMPIKNVLNLFRPNLHIVNVNNDHHVDRKGEYQEQRSLLQEMFREYRPEFHLISAPNVHESIHKFVQDQNIDLLITIPRKHSLIDSIFLNNTTKKLVYRSSVPVLTAHE